MFLELATEHLVSVLAQEITGFAVRYLTSRAASAASPRAGRSESFVRSAQCGAQSTEIVSDTPGRARLRVVGVRDNPARAAAVVRQCRAIPGVVRVEASPITGTVLIRYNPDRVTVASIRSTLERARMPPSLERARRAGCGS